MAASSDALGAFKSLAVNPVGGLDAAYGSLGPQRSLAAGLVFGVAFALIVVFSFAVSLMKLDLSLNVRGIFTVLLAGLVPFLAIAGACAVGRKVFRGEGGSLGGDVFIAGASLVPFGIFLLASGLLGVANIEVIVLLGVFACCYSLNMLFVGAGRLSGIPEAYVTPAVAVILLLTAWLTKIILASVGGSTAKSLFGLLFS